MEKENRPTRILIVDDHPIFRQGLAALLNDEQDLEVCGEASDYADALRFIESLRPDFSIIDISLLSSNGLHLIKRIRADNNNIKILVASMHDENRYAERSIRTGANGYINKQEPAENIIEAIRAVLSGKVYLSEAIAERILKRHLQGAEQYSDIPEEVLTDRELEVFSLIGQGHSTKIIADLLSLSSKTIDTHRENIKRKLDVKDNSALIRQAVEWVR